VEQRPGHALEAVILANEKRIKRVAIQFFAPAHAAKERGQPWKTIELKVVRRRDGDVAWIA